VRKALELAPNHHMARSMAGWALGKALMEIQDFAAAVPVLEETVSTLCMRSSTPTPAAMPEGDRAAPPGAQEQPRRLRSHVLMGSALVLSGDAAGAVRGSRKRLRCNRRCQSRTRCCPMCMFSSGKSRKRSGAG